MSESFKHIKGKKKLGSYPHFTVVFSITMALFVIGLFALIFIHARKISTIAQENIEMNVILDKTIQKNQRISIKRILSAQPYILKIKNVPQIQYISEEAAKKKFIETHGQDFTKVLGDNPLHASFLLKIHPRYSDSTQMSVISKNIDKLDGVKEVFYLEDVISKINKNIEMISFILIGFALILIMAAVLLINNTIKLALYSQRFLIRSMQLVGATRGFIQRPFILRALVQGVFSGGLAVAGLVVLLKYAYSQLGDLKDLQENENTLIILSSLVVLGAIVGLVSSYMSVSKYLKMSLDELY